MVSAIYKTKVHNNESQLSHLLFYSFKGARGATSVEYTLIHVSVTVSVWGGDYVT